MKIKMYLIGALVGLGFAITQAGVISIEPQEGQFTYNCPFEVSIMVDTEEQVTSTIGLALFTDDSVFAINKFISKGGIFPSYTTIKTTKARWGGNAGNPIAYIMGTTASQKTFKGKGKFGTLVITPLLGVKDMELKLYNAGSLADDTNINVIDEDGNSIEGLTETINGHYTFIEGECDSPHLAPIVLNDAPPSIVNNENYEEPEQELKEELVDIKEGIKGDVKGDTQMVLGTLLIYKWYVLGGLLLLIIIIILLAIHKKKK